MIKHGKVCLKMLVLFSSGYILDAIFDMLYRGLIYTCQWYVWLTRIILHVKLDDVQPLGIVVFVGTDLINLQSMLSFCSGVAVLSYFPVLSLTCKYALSILKDRDCPQKSPNQYKHMKGITFS